MNERIFAWSDGLRPMPVFCYALTAAVIVFFCGRAAYGRAEDLRMLFAIVFILGPLSAAAMCGLSFVRFLRYEKQIRMDDAGITIRKDRIAWEEILKIEPVLGNSMPLKLVLDHDRVWSTSLRYIPSEVLLPHREFVYRELLPEIVKRAPRVEVAERVKRHLEDPESAMALSAAARVIRFVALVGSVAIFSGMLGGPELGFVPWLIACGIVAAMDVVGLLAGVRGRRDARQAFIRIAFACGALLSFGLVVNAMLVQSVPGRVAMTSMAVVLSASALLLLVLGRVPSKRMQVAMALLLAATPVAGGAYAVARAWPMQDLSASFVASEPFVPDPCLWGRSGVYLAPWTADNLDRVVCAADGTVVNVPMHRGGNRVAWLDERLLVRRVSQEDEPDRLFAYRFATREETEIASASNIRIGTQRPRSPDGRHLAWIERTKEDGPWTLRMFDLDARTDALEAVTLPDNVVSWKGARPVWVDDGTVLVRGEVVEGEKVAGVPVKPATMRVSLDGSVVGPTISGHVARAWRIAPDGKHLLGITPEGKDWDVCTLAVLDLADDSMRELEGKGNYPLMTFDPDLCVRTVKRDGRLAITRIDLDAGSERVIGEVPSGLALVGVSRRGTFALCARSGLLAANTCTVVHLPSGATRRVDLPGRLYFPLMVVFQTRSGMNLFAPDERRFILEVTRILGPCGTIVVTIPDDWPE